MPNGEMLDTLQHILESDQPATQNVTNLMILAAVQETYKKVKVVSEQVDGLTTRMCTLEQNIVTDKAVKVETDKDKLTASSLWANYGRDIVKLLIVAAITWFLSRAGATP